MSGLSVSVKSHFTSGASVRSENTIAYCRIFSETTLLQRSSTPSIESYTYIHTVSHFLAETVHAHYSIYHVLVVRLKPGGVGQAHTCERACVKDT